MKQGFFTVTENIRLAPNTFRMVLSGDTSAIAGPGQFVNIALTGKFLRRCHFYIRIGLIVLQHRIVLRTMFLDQIVFQHQCFELRVRDDIFKAADP